MDTDVLVTCEICGHDILLSVANWHECMHDEEE